MNYKNFALILDESPIGRAYLQFFQDSKIKIHELIYLGSKIALFQSLYINYNFHYTNNIILKYLQNPKIISLIDKIEDTFNLRKDFFIDTYKAKNLEKICNELYFCRSKKVNSKELKNIVSNIKSQNIINTGRQILKEILDLNKTFIHIHPGYLPAIKGADSSLWMLKKFSYLGCSSFIMNKEIDNGKIILREKIFIKELNILDKNFDKEELYNIWFSFFDPAIRVYYLKNLIPKIQNNEITSTNYDHEESNYHSFMNKEDADKIIRKVFQKS
jgi:hypothetical protein